MLECAQNIASKILDIACEMDAVSRNLFIVVVAIIVITYCPFASSE